MKIQIQVNDGPLLVGYPNNPTVKDVDAAIGGDVFDQTSSSELARWVCRVAAALARIESPDGAHLDFASVGVDGDTYRFIFDNFDGSLAAGDFRAFENELEELCLTDAQYSRLMAAQEAAVEHFEEDIGLISVVKAPSRPDFEPYIEIDELVRAFEIDTKPSKCSCLGFTVTFKPGAQKALDELLQRWSKDFCNVEVKE